MVQRVSLRSQDFILVHADILCVCRAHCNSVICDLAAGYLEAFVSAGFRGSQPELEGNRNVLNATKQAPQRRRLLKFWGVLPTKGGVCCAAVWLRVGEVRKGPLPPFPCEGQFPQHYKYSGLVAGCWLQGAGCWLLVGEAGRGRGPT